MKENMKIRGQLRTYLQWPIILSVFLLAANLAVGIVSPAAGLVMSGFTVIYVLVALWLFIYRRKRLMGGLVEFSAEYAWVQKQLLYEMAVPYAIADTEGHFLWLNHSFSEIVGEDKNCRKNIAAVFPELTREFLDEMDEKTSVHSSFDGRFYRIDIQQVALSETEGMKLGAVDEDSGEMLLVLYLCDETEILRCKQQINNQRLVAGLIYLDNYDEALESVEEVRRSLLVALIDRKITKYFMAMEGIVKKLENDKYLFVIKQQYTKEIQESRFSILEDVKTVNIGNDMAVTLSIGMGMNGDSYIRNYEYARTAIDMALGRGGDQAVVKDGTKIRYYGGKSQQLEKTTRVKARVKAHAMRELMDTKDKMLIMGHKIGDTDSFGAAIGIWRIATSFNKKARIVINGVNSSVKPMMARFENSSDYPEDLFLTGEEAAEWADSNTMLVVVDVNRPSITEAPELLKQIKTIVVLDHHRQSSEIIDNAVLSYVEPYASSACEMVAEVLQYIGDDGIKIKPAEADAMYAGIVIDTNNFMNQAGVRTFEAAAFLRRNGADVVRVRKLFRDRLEDYRARAEAIQKAEIYHGAFAISVCPSEGLESPTVVGAQAANELLDIVGIKARVKAHAMRELMDTKDKMLIMGHKIGDTDSFGAAIGIWRIATSFNKKARIVINGVNSSVKPMMARFENSSDYPEDLFLTGEEAAEWADSNTMLVVVDVNRPSITEAPELLKQIKTIVVLDHHRQSSEIIDNAVLSYVEPYASSACEMVAEVLQYIGDDGIKIKPAEADAMYAGIVIDTNNFMNQAGVRTFEAAAFLRRNGADVVRVRKLFRDRLEDYRARAEAIQKAEIYHGAFAISVCPSEGLESPTVVGAQAANELLDIVGIKASFILTQMGDTIYFSARSIDEINVQIIMERLGGGGHRTIAGAQLKGATIDEAREKLKDLITDMMEKGEI